MKKNEAHYWLVTKTKDPDRERIKYLIDSDEFFAFFKAIDNQRGGVFIKEIVGPENPPVGYRPYISWDWVAHIYLDE